MPVTFDPIEALMRVSPVADPCTVMLPVWLTAAVVMLMVFAASPRLSSSRLPVPVIPPVKTATAFVVSGATGTGLL